jgi:hypothetical protein
LVDFAATVFLAAVGVFAGFFIAFAIGSTTKWVMLRRIQPSVSCARQADFAHSTPASARAS